MYITPLTQDISTDLESSLQQCQTSARRGYQIASDNIKETASAIEIVSKSISECLKNHDKGSANTPEIISQLKNQFVSVVNELKQLQNKTEKDLLDRKIRLDSFSITLFGRTMAGKSTLMEILTHGEGKSIGSGSQRTTRDIRSYTWKGLEVTDVPGVAAFEGEEDEELAFHAAAQADLVIFLITDDAPQPLEAECLAQVRRLGKPILGICNVKIAVDDPDDLLLFLRNSNRSFDQNRLKGIFQQFNDFADQCIPGKHVRFAMTHLRSRFLAERHEFQKYKSELIEASRFTFVERQIINEVKGRGSFLRIKSFIDGAVAPMMQLTYSLLDFSAQNSASGRVLVEKRRQLNNWGQNFKSDGQGRIDTLVSKLMDGLRQDVSDFAENHYDDNQASEKWDKHIKSAGINQKCETLLRHLSEECKKAMQEIARELKSELSFMTEFSTDKSIKMDGIFDSKRWWNWGTSILSGGLGLYAIIIASGPIGWAAAAVGLFGWLGSLFFDDREKKARNARENLSKKLYDNIDKMERNLKRQLQDWFFKELIKKQVDVLLNDISAIATALFELADAQRNLAWTLNKRIKHLNRNLVEEGLKHVNAVGMEHHILDIARVPGTAMMFVIRPGTKFPEQIKINLERLLDESIWFVIDNGNPKSMLSQAIGRGCDRNKISIEAKLKVAHTPLDELDPLTLTRVQLAQQLTGLHITK
jgi:hypothetical protein